MIQEYNIRISPEQSEDKDKIIKHLSQEKGIDSKDINEIRIVKKSIDARQKNIFVQMKVLTYINETAEEILYKPVIYKKITSDKKAIIVGAGPGGLFAALKLIELGIKPVIIERGKNVRDRKKDIAKISRENIVNPESNYCFGEGGAGAYSDGKLYTRSKKRGDINRILQIFCQFGAKNSILYDAHPHIGTDKLPGIIEAIRNKITECGGEVRFNTKMDDIILKGNKAIGIRTENGEEFTGPVILATGHSARDVYRLLYNKKIKQEAKSLAIGVRLEHPQELIDQIMYHSAQGRGKYLPAAEYNMTMQVKNRGVYSFCMCPGGFVVPASSGPEQIVVNGMSTSNRNSKWANSGMVTEIRTEDIPEYKNTPEELKMITYQEVLEKSCFQKGNCMQTAPAQRMDDFVNKRNSANLPSSSYAPGIINSDLHNWLPENISKRLTEGFKYFGKTKRGFLTNEAVLIGVETRTSSPVRILRNRETLQHVSVDNLFPCGEGAGYAGGIVSAAIDGENCANNLASICYGY